MTHPTRRLQSGQAIVLIAIMLAVVVGMAALAIDGSRAYALRRDLQAAVDAAALTAGDNFQQTGSYTYAEQQATASFGTNNLVSTGGADAFVSKLTSDGDFLWAKSGGGGAEDIAVDERAVAHGDLDVGHLDDAADIPAQFVSSSGPCTQCPRQLPCKHAGCGVELPEQIHDDRIVVESVLPGRRVVVERRGMVECDDP